MTRKKLIITIAASVLAVAVACVLAIVLLGNGNDDPAGGKTEWPEAGIYYFDAKYDEYTLTLNEGDTFNLFVKGEFTTGSYTLDGSTLTLDFKAEGKPNVQATLQDGVVTLNYGGTSMRMLKKMNYTVSFETNGGEAIDNATVVNGKTAAKPADPVRDGYLFIGWYADAEFKTPFTFESEGISADTVLYARWSEAGATNTEYEIRFDLGYGDEKIESVKTQGGKLFSLPTPSARDGYEFGGWWVSMLSDGAKLTYEYKEGAVLDASMTLHALWIPTSNSSVIPEPIVNVGKGSVSWGAVSGARSYYLQVLNSAGTVIFKTETANTSVNVPFDTYAAGEYKITLTAQASTGDSNNSTAVRYYVNKSLPKVSVFNVVEPAILNFNTVPGAEKYLITVICGNPDHNHTAFDNGTSRSFSFANCEMTEDGIRFTVTAVAEGYASSTSEVFTYKRELAPVEGLKVDASGETVSWNEVAGALGYIVSISCANPSHNHEGYVTSLAVSLKECAKGDIKVKVYPYAKGYISPEAKEVSFEKTTLSTPSDVRISDKTVSWTAVTGANEYEVKVGDKTYKVSGTSFDISASVNLSEGTKYTVSVRALGSANSLWSNEITAVYLDKPQNLSYSGSILSWSPVIGVSSYEIQINGETPTLVSGKNSSEITLTKAGTNEIKVRYVDGNDRSEWSVISVYAHTITFDSRGGNQIDVQYKAVGDKITLPKAKKSGYDFVAWYNVPGGPLSNGRLYSDEIFTESGSIVLYAHYTALEVNVTLNAGSEAGGDKTTSGISFEEYYQLAVPTPTSPTMAFGGWYSAPGGLGQAYTDAKGNSLAPWNSLVSVELHAYWIDYALSFTLTKHEGKDVYMVSAGDRIAMLQEVTVPANFNDLPVALVAGNAFKNCTTLKVINLPSTIAQISLVDPFTGCTSLEAVNVYDAGGSTSRYWSDNGVLFDNGSASVAQTKLSFMPLAKTGSYRIPAGITEIPAGAFANSSLSRITVPASVNTIGSEAFSNCYNLTSITFENASGAGALTIAERAFLNCAMLEKITLPARLTSIALTKYSVTDSVVSLDAAENAFLGCHSLANINVADGNSVYKSVNGILYSADKKTLLYCPSTVYDEFTIPDSTNTIAPGAFIGCDQITSVIFPNTVTAIGEYAFYGLKTYLSSVTFRGNGFNDVSIGKYAFSGCTKLTDVSFGSGSRISVIDEGAFYATGITSFNIPATVSKIGRLAFGDCSKLESLSFSTPTSGTASAISFEEDVFSGCASLTSVHIPAHVSEIPGIFGGCIALTDITVDPDNPHFESIDGVVFNEDKTEILFFPMGKTGEYTLPSTVTSIANGVFSYTTGITKLILPNTLSSIGEGAFEYSNIESIVFAGDTLADGLTVGDRAFKMTTKLKSLELPEHTKSIGKNAFEGSAVSNLTLNEGLESIGEYAFASTYGLFDLEVPGSVKMIGDNCFSGSLIMNLTLNEGVEVIGKHAFENLYYLTSIHFPASVTTIDDYAFSGVMGLSSVTFADGSKLESIGAYAFSRTPITSIKLSKSLKSIGAYAFFYCQNLQSVTFEDGGTADLVIGTPFAYTHKDSYTDTMVTEILSGHVFEKTTSLTTVTFPSNLKEIKTRSFEGAGAKSGLSVSFGENSRLTTIGEYCFYDSTLTEITIPKSVCNLDPVINDEFGLTYDRLGIGAYAFASSAQGTSKLESVTFEFGGDAPLTIGVGAFKNASLLSSATLPKRLAPYSRANETTAAGLEGGSSVFAGATALKSVDIEDGGSHYADFGGVVYTSDLKELLFCPIGFEGAVTIPASVEKINDKAFFGCSEITSITFAGGEADMVVGDSVFEGCTKITSIVLPSNVTKLGERAFANCTKLESITLSKHITTFDGSMIINCPSLKNIVVEDGNTGFFYDNGALYSADRTVLVLFTSSNTATTVTLLPTTEIILSGAFANNKTVTTIILPEGLREIGSSAFSGCSSLANLVIPSSVELIGAGAFDSCFSLSNPVFEKGGDTPLHIGERAFVNSGISSVEFPARLASIGNEAFADTSVTEVVFEAGSKLDSLGDSVFADSAIKEITLPEGLTAIGNGCFMNSKLERIYLPASLKTMGTDTFRQCRSLKDVVFAEDAQLEIIPAGTFSGSSIETVTIPAAVITIDSKEEGNFSSYGAFESCTSLVSITFENGRLAEIGKNAFYGCTALREIVIPSTVSSIGFLAFYKCTSLESATIPAATTRIGHSLFYGCTALKNVTLESLTTELPTYMFYNCSSLTSITIPRNVTTLGDDCFFGTSLEEFNVAPGNTAYASRDGVLYTADLTEALIYPAMKKDASITIPKEVTSISSDIFTAAASLKEIFFEEGGNQPLSIGSYAFKDCYQLHTVILPKRLETIGASAFENCSSLISITIPENVKKIDGYAFWGCEKLVEVYNKSSLSITKSEDNGHVGYYALNIYTPVSGSSIISVSSDGFVTAFVTSEELTYLIGYVGSEKNLTIPSGVDAIYKKAFYRIEGIESILIPKGVGSASVGSNAFVNCGEPTIFFEDSKIPTTWGSGWNSDGCPVLIGYDGKDHTYTFLSDSAEAAESVTSSGIITLPVLRGQSGLVFAGWCDNPELTGTVYTSTYYSSEKTTLYAKWLLEGEELPTEPDGESTETAIDVELDKSYTVLIDYSEKKVHYAFTPTVSGIYHAYLAGHSEAKLELKNSLKSYYGTVDTDLPLFMAGTTYYFVVSLTSSATTELSFTLSLSLASGGEGDDGDGGNTDGGNGFDDAIELELGKEGSALIEKSGNLAYFKFVATKSGKFNFYVYGKGASVTVYSADRTSVVDTMSVSDISSNKDITLTEGEIYYVTVSIPSDNFRVYVKIKEATEAPGGNTPGGTSSGFDSATPLYGSLSTNLTFATVGQKMYFVYTAAISGAHQIRTDSGWSYSAVEVYDSNKTLIAGPFEDSMGIINKSVNMTAGNTYYIAVYMRYSGTGTVSFSFTVPEAQNEPEKPGEGDELVGGTGYDDAIEIALDSKYTISFDTKGKKIYFKFTAPEDGAYHAYVSGSANTMLQVWRDAENSHQPTIYANWGTGLIDKDLEVFTAGETYYIVISVSESTADLEFIFTKAQAEAE